MISILLTGKFLRTIDEKNRVAIPKSLRESLHEQSHQAFYLAPGTDGSVAVYPEQAFAQWADRLASTSPAARDVRDYSRLFFSQTTSVKLDGQGRLRIPPELMRWAKLGEQAVLLGVQDHMEIWQPAEWESYAAQRQERYDQIAESALDSRHSPKG